MANLVELPLISVEGLDVKTHANQEALETALEHWWVERNIGLVFDATGKRLRLLSKPPKIAIVGIDKRQSDSSIELKKFIVDSLQSVEVEIDYSCSLEQAIAALIDREKQEKVLSSSSLKKILRRPTI